MEKKEYIERGAALLAIAGQPSELHYPSWYKGNIMEVPAADVVEVVHAKWIDSKYGNVNCGHCGIRRRAPKSDDDDRFYCSNCGAKMDGGKK
jgi:hypothetical protein